MHAHAHTPSLFLLQCQVSCKAVSPIVAKRLYSLYVGKVHGPECRGTERDRGKGGKMKGEGRKRKGRREERRGGLEVEKAAMLP